MKIITKNISADIYDYLDINKTYKIKMIERYYPVKGFWARVNHFGRKEYTLLELWAEEEY